jgi:hypothetical protein
MQEQAPYNREAMRSGQVVGIKMGEKVEAQTQGKIEPEIKRRDRESGNPKRLVRQCRLDATTTAVGDRIGLGDRTERAQASRKQDDVVEEEKVEEWPNGGKREGREEREAHVDGWQMETGGLGVGMGARDRGKETQAITSWPWLGC